MLVVSTNVKTSLIRQNKAFFLGQLLALRTGDIETMHGIGPVRLDQLIEALRTSLTPEFLARWAERRANPYLLEAPVFHSQSTVRDMLIQSGVSAYLLREENVPEIRTEDLSLRNALKYKTVYKANHLRDFLPYTRGSLLLSGLTDRGLHKLLAAILAALPPNSWDASMQRAHAVKSAAAAAKALNALAEMAETTGTAVLPARAWDELRGASVEMLVFSKNLRRRKMGAMPLKTSACDSALGLFRNVALSAGGLSRQ